MIKAMVRVSGPTGPLQVVLDLPRDATVQNLLDALAATCPPLDAAFRLGLADHLIAVNSKHAPRRSERLIKEDEETADVSVTIIPPMLGG